MIPWKVLNKITDIELQDNPNSEAGGIAFAGETVLDFLLSIDECDVECMRGIDDLNRALDECGIMPIKGE